MAGQLKIDEMRDILQRLNAVNNLCDSTVATFVQSQKDLSKALETQKYLNKSVMPLFTAFVPQEDHVSPQNREHP
ncbi:hypothetical protein AAFF_G00268770 [Aldrovandia affinis]|uniref:Uncharacterized protein n=1 Tax=Aldrovandia affinis TaxID=143900 RepID=A0AAD7WSX4_9TELE|nr:hypothetical protein AAFF_G00268770 [Aldrovandia affinis]